MLVLSCFYSSLFLFLWFHFFSSFFPRLQLPPVTDELLICFSRWESPELPLPSVHPPAPATHPPPPFPRLRGKCLHALLLSRGRRHFSLKPASYRLPPRPSNQNTSNYSINTILDYLHSSEAWFLTVCVSHFLSRLWLPFSPKQSRPGAFKLFYSSPFRHFWGWKGRGYQARLGTYPWFNQSVFICFAYCLWSSQWPKYENHQSSIHIIFSWIFAGPQKIMLSVFHPYSPVTLLKNFFPEV